MAERPSWYGLIAQFEDPNAVLAAAHRVREAGYRRTDAYSPFPVEGLSEALGFRRTRLPLVVLIGGLIGGLGGYFMQWYSSVISYPMNIAGRPYHSWPSFIPVTFELTVLCAAFGAVLGMLALNGLPMPYHPVFNVNSFALATRNRFFLLIESRDPLFELDKTRTFLQGLGAKEVTEVAW
jgi:hypothetical protein